MIGAPHRVFVADDHALFREGVKALLAEESDLVVAGEAGTAKETLQRVRNEDWDVLLLDISLPDGSGIDLLRQIRPHKPNLPILILSMHPEEQFAVSLLRAARQATDEARMYDKFASATDALHRAKQRWRDRRRVASVAEAVDQSVQDTIEPNRSDD